MRKRTTLDRIAEEFAEAVASLEFERAEGWLATAFLSLFRAGGGYLPQ